MQETFHKISPEELRNNPFHMIGKDWMLVTAEKEGKVNTMTASWGGVGVLWNRNVVYVFIRPQRYTKEFIDNAETFSLSVLPQDYKKTLSYLGTVSGRDEDKIAKSGLTVAHDGATPYFEEAETVLVCRKLYRQEMTPESFIDESLVGANYPNNDYHAMYVAEIQDVLVKG